MQKILSERMEETLDNTKHLLGMALSAAVPIWIERLRLEPWSYVQERANACADIVAGKGDIIMFRSKKKGETAGAFNALAEGIACLAFCPGGVKMFGEHWEAAHPSLDNGNDNERGKAEKA